MKKSVRNPIGGNVESTIKMIRRSVSLLEKLNGGKGNRFRRYFNWSILQLSPDTRAIKEAGKM